jgi:hypothetical protein
MRGRRVPYVDRAQKKNRGPARDAAQWEETPELINDRDHFRSDRADRKAFSTASKSMRLASGAQYEWPSPAWCSGTNADPNIEPGMIWLLVLLVGCMVTSLNPRPKFAATVPPREVR